MFNNNPNNSNPFQNQTQGTSFTQNQTTTSPFQNNRTTTGSPFQNNQTGGTNNNPFSSQNTTNPQTFNNPNPFSNQGQTQQQTNPFSQGQTQGGSFTQGQTQSPFTQGQTQQQTNPFSQGQTQGGPFTQGQTQQTSPFSQGQANQGQNNQLFSNQRTGGNQSYSQGNPYNQTPIGSIVPSLEHDALAFSHQLESIRKHIEECLNRLNIHSLDYLRVDQSNMFKDQPMNKLPLKNESVELIKNFKILKKTIENVRKQSLQIEKKSNDYINETHKKLTLYKECLLQTTSQTKLINQVNSEITMMNQQIQEFFKPLYNSYKMKKPITLKDPDEFTLKISYDILNKMLMLNQKIDDLLACQSQLENEEVHDTIIVFEQLIQYYENISCSFNEFKEKYSTMKKLAIQKERRGSYQLIMSKVQEKVGENMNKEFKYYDLIKEVDEILEKREKRDEKKKYDERVNLNTLYH